MQTLAVVQTDSVIPMDLLYFISCMGTPPYYSAMFLKWDNIYDSLFAELEDVGFPKESTLKANNLLRWKHIPSFIR